MARSKKPVDDFYDFYETRQSVKSRKPARQRYRDMRDEQDRSWSEAYSSKQPEYKAGYMQGRGAA